MQSKQLSPLWFVNTISVTILFSAYAQYLWRYNFEDLPLFKGQPPGVSLMFVGLAVSIFLWLFAPWNVVKNKGIQLVISMLILTWLGVMLMSLIHGDAFTYAVWTYIPTILLLTFKAPSAKDLKTAIVVMGGLIAALIIATRLLEMLGILSVAPIGDYLIEFENENYWLPLSGSLGPDFRWPGPMGHNATTGVAGAYLLVVGTAIRGKSGIFFVITGALTLLLTSSRVSMVSAAVGIAIVVVLGDSRLTRKLPWRVRVTAVSLVAAGAAGLALIASPNLTGRTSYWPAFVDLWLESPWIGVGLSGKVVADASIAGTNAHNIFLDILTIYGVVPLLTMSLALIVISMLAYQSAKNGQVLPLAIVSTFLVVGLTQSDYGWSTPSAPWWLLLLAAFLAATHESKSSSSDVGVEVA